MSKLWYVKKMWVITLLALLSTPGVTALAKSSQPADKDQQASSKTDNSALVSQGRKFYNNHRCVTCHSTNGTRKLGPSLQGLYGSKVKLNNGQTVMANEEYIKHSITHPADNLVKGYPALMPASYSDLSQSDLNALVAFIKSLENDSGSQQ